ncbi:hypothetical protein IKF02_03555 [Candidatus Saccharibacteria bacterium]|nr:hypothetical protein [Candidatus Saccharibacteria bacterium]
MSGKYMDFVPVGAQRVTQKKAVVRSVVDANKKVELDELKLSQIMKEREVVRRAGVSENVGPKFGVIEDFQQKFVKTEVKKRPLNNAQKAKEELAAAKAKKILKESKVDKPAVEVKEEAPKEDTLKVPKSRFVNTEKVKKRPLSKNVYQKEVVALEEKPTGPITIISKPEKDSKAGLIVTIIITIILGAAAGTVAFLLLPK